MGRRGLYCIQIKRIKKSQAGGEGQSFLLRSSPLLNPIQVRSDIQIISGIFTAPSIIPVNGKFSGHPLNLSGLFALAHHYRAGLAWRS
jgi:hypothetical protein